MQKDVFYLPHAGTTRMAKRIRKQMTPILLTYTTSVPNHVVNVEIQNKNKLDILIK